MRRRGLLALASLVGLAAIPGAPALRAALDPSLPQTGEACAACHAEIVRAIAGTAHAENLVACARCHGDSRAHLAAGGARGSIRDLRRVSAREASRICLACHAAGSGRHWARSAHDAPNVSCLTCHEPHPSGAASEKLLRRPQRALCASCHWPRKAAPARSSHLPEREGGIACTSCHDPHGTPYEGMLRQATVNENCYGCHADLRGPFLHEHAPVGRNCLACHDPHGTADNYSLKSRPPSLCLQCHKGVGAGMGSAHTARERYALKPDCLDCHPAVHGSNRADGTYLRR